MFHLNTEKLCSAKSRRMTVCFTLRCSQQSVVSNREHFFLLCYSSLPLTQLLTRFFFLEKPPRGRGLSYCRHGLCWIFIVGLSLTGRWVAFVLVFVVHSARLNHSPNLHSLPSLSLPSCNLCGCQDVDRLPCDPLQLYTWHMQLLVGGSQPGGRCSPLNLKQTPVKACWYETISSFHSCDKYAGSDRSVVGVQSCKGTSLGNSVWIACCPFSRKIWVMQLHLQYKITAGDLRGDTPCKADR